MGQQISIPAPQEVPNREACRHHWIIEAPTGPASVGVCQRCEAAREFKNYIDATAWGEETSVPQSVEKLPIGESPEDAESAEEL